MPPPNWTYLTFVPWKYFERALRSISFTIALTKRFCRSPWYFAADSLKHAQKLQNASQKGMWK